MSGVREVRKQSLVVRRMLEQEVTPQIMLERWGIMQIIKSEASLLVHMFSRIGDSLGTGG